MIKFCIVLALLADITLSTTYCDTNQKILPLSTSCFCLADGANEVTNKKICQSGCQGATNTHYCKKVGATYTLGTIPTEECRVKQAWGNMMGGGKYSGGDCNIDNVICAKNGVYKGSGTVCKTIPDCPENEILSGNIPCYCHDTEITGQERDNNYKEPSLNGKWCKKKDNASPVVVSMSAALTKCTAFEKITDASSNYCLPIYHSNDIATKICYNDEYTDANTNKCTPVPSTTCVEGTVSTDCKFGDAICVVGLAFYNNKCQKNCAENKELEEDQNFEYGCYCGDTLISNNEMTYDSSERKYCKNDRSTTEIKNYAALNSCPSESKSVATDCKDTMDTICIMGWRTLEGQGGGDPNAPTEYSCIPTCPINELRNEDNPCDCVTKDQHIAGGTTSWCKKSGETFTIKQNSILTTCDNDNAITNSDCKIGSNEGDKICVAGQYISVSAYNKICLDPVDGVLSAWSTCTQTCGTGTKTRSCTTEAAYGGTACSTDLQQNCNTIACPAADSVEDAATSSTIAKKSSALKFGIHAVLIAGIFHFM